jgi:hypothetical protein
LGAVVVASAVAASVMTPAMRRGNDKSNGGMLTRIVEQVVPTVVDSIDLNKVLDQVDINALLEDVDVNALVARIDIDALLDRVDIDGIIDRVDINGIVQRVDIDGLLDEVDVASIAKRADIGDLVAESTTSVAGSALDLGRRQIVGLDAIVDQFVDRVMGRDPSTMKQGPKLLVPIEEAGSAA